MDACHNFLEILADHKYVDIFEVISNHFSGRYFSQNSAWVKRLPPDLHNGDTSQCQHSIDSAALLSPNQWHNSYR